MDLFTERFAQLCSDAVLHTWQVKLDRYHVVHLYPPDENTASQLLTSRYLTKQMADAVERLQCPCALVHWPGSDTVCYRIEAGCDRAEGIQFSGIGEDQQP